MQNGAKLINNLRGMEHNMITVFTPTYNRGYIIDRVYNSLLNQTNYDFEWIIIDDDSTDGTEIYIRKIIQSKNPFPIYYDKQKHGGKHRAINRAIKIAQGDFFFIVDSDDYIIPQCIDLLYEWVTPIKNDDSFAGVSGLKMSKNGNILGGNIANSTHGYIDAGNLERRKYKLLGDKAECYKTMILREFPFPEYENEYFVSEAVVWDKIALAGYKLRWYDKVIMICDYLDDGLTKNMSVAMLEKNYNGYVAYLKGIMNYEGYSWLQRTSHFWMYIRIVRRNKLRSVADSISDIGIEKCQYYYYKYIMLPIYLALRTIDFCLKNLIVSMRSLYDAISKL